MTRNCWSPGASAPLKDAPKSVFLKRKYCGVRVEAPVCAHIRDEQYLACIMSSDDACYRHFKPRDVRRVDLHQNPLLSSAGVFDLPDNASERSKDQWEN